MASFKTNTNKENAESMYNGGIDYEGTKKRNPIVLHAIIDNDWNMYYRLADDEAFSRIADIEEHDERINYMSDGCEHSICYLEYLRRGKQGVPYRFTRVYGYDDKTNAAVNGKHQKFMKFTVLRNLVTNLRIHETFKKKPIFATGCPEFLAALAPYADKVYLTRVLNTDKVEIAEVLKFPKSIFKQYFTKREILKSNIAIENARLNAQPAPDFSDDFITEYLGNIRVSRRLTSTEKEQRRKEHSIKRLEYEFHVYSK